MMKQAEAFGPAIAGSRAARRSAEMKVYEGVGVVAPLRHGAMSTAPQSLNWLDRTEPQTALRAIGTGMPDIVCFAHMRWDFPHQRPHHIMSRGAREHRVFYIEEPIYSTGSSIWLDISQRECGVWVVVPYLPEGIGVEEERKAQADLLEELFSELAITNFIAWYYRPAALEFTRHLKPSSTIYDCIDVTAADEKDATLLALERELLAKADLVFAAGESVFKTKQRARQDLYLCANGVDFEHFATAREVLDEPADQARIPYPRLGYCGVIDSRIDFKLLDAIAQSRPDWQLVMVGPIIGIDPESLPQHPNIHYLGAKPYEQLPAYIAGWETAMLPFVRNDDTRAANPVKIAEYLAAGKPTISTSISDVVHNYGRKRMVHIADTLAEFVIAAAEAGMDEIRDLADWLENIDHYFVGHSWDRTWSRMKHLMNTMILAPR